MSFLINPYIFGLELGFGFWTNLLFTSGKIVTGFVATFTDALTVSWGDGTTTPLTSGVSVNKILGATNDIKLKTRTLPAVTLGQLERELGRPPTLEEIQAREVNAVVTKIICGTSSPRLGGTINLSAFPNLQEFRCNSNDITALSGYAQNSNFKNIQFFDNKVIGSIPSLSALNNLENFYCYSNQLSGSIPSLSGLIRLQNFVCHSNQLTGTIPSLSGLNDLQNFSCLQNQLTGSIPSLSGLGNLKTFYCYSNQLTGSIPSLSGLSSLIDFACYSNQLTGTIPRLNGEWLTNLRIFRCNNNQLTGTIPSLSGLNNLQFFYCYSNQLTGTIPNLSQTTNLKDFRCNNNQLTGSIPYLRDCFFLENFVCYSNQLTGLIPNLSGVYVRSFYCYSNQLTGFAGENVSGYISNSLGDFRAENNLLTAKAVNAILAAFVLANKTTGTRILNLGGTGNASPTGQGITDKATLISRGWTVTTN